MRKSSTFMPALALGIAGVIGTASPSLARFRSTYGSAVGSRLGAAFAFVLATALLLPAGAAVRAQCTASSDELFGSLLDSAEYDAAVRALPPAALLTPPVQPPLPSRAFLTNLPAVSQQGTTQSPGFPGACEAQSFGYGLGSYTAARQPDGLPKWNPALPQNSVSPAYLFAWAVANNLATCPKGGQALPYLNHLVALGAATRARIPYQPDCTYLDGIPTEIEYPGMQRFRIGSYAGFHIDQDPPAAVQIIKEYIANGQAVAFSGRVLCGYDHDLQPQMQDGVIYGTDYIIGQNGKPQGHGQLVVGYDDDVGTPGTKVRCWFRTALGRLGQLRQERHRRRRRAWSTGPTAASSSSR
jgi:hypothetical protein